MKKIAIIEYNLLHYYCCNNKKMTKKKTTPVSQQKIKEKDTMSVYKVTTNSVEAVAGGMLHLDSILYVRVTLNPEVWREVVNGHRTIVLSAAELLQIENDTNLTIVQKRAAIREIIKREALAMGIDSSDDAYTKLQPLFTPPFDITVRDA